MQKGILDIEENVLALEDYVKTFSYAFCHCCEESKSTHHLVFLTQIIEEQFQKIYDIIDEC